MSAYTLPINIGNVTQFSTLVQQPAIGRAEQARARLEPHLVLGPRLRFSGGS